MSECHRSNEDDDDVGGGGEDINRSGGDGLEVGTQTLAEVSCLIQMMMMMMMIDTARRCASHPMVRWPLEPKKRTVERCLH